MITAIYARYSSENQRDESIDAQVRAIKEFAQRNSHSIVRIYTDEAKSATTDQRPQFQQMIKDAENGSFEAVIVHKLDRFSRDRYDSATYKRRLKLCGVRLLSVLENLDDSPESVIMESVLEGMAEYYSRNLSRETKKGLIENALQSKHTGGKPALGYDVDINGKYIINIKESETVKLIFAMKLSGNGYSAIIDELNRGGHKTKRGSKFGKNSLHDLLKNEKYIGNLIYNKTVAKDARHKRNNHASKSEDEIIRIDGGCPAIIDIDTWKKVQEAMKFNVKKRGMNKAKEPYTLSGLIFCGKCGGAMTGNFSTKGEYLYRYYECSTRRRMRTCDKETIKKAYIESEVVNALYNRLFAPNAIIEMTEYLFSNASQRNEGSEEKIMELKRQLHEIQNKIDKIIDAIENGLFHPSMKERMDEHEMLKTNIELQINELHIQKSISVLTRDQISAYLSRFSNIKEMSLLEQREVIRLFVKRVTIYDDHADLEIFMDGGKPYVSKFLDSTGATHGSPKNLLREIFYFA